MRALTIASVGVVIVCAQLLAQAPSKGYRTPPTRNQQAPSYKLQPKQGKLYSYDNTVQIMQTLHIMDMEQPIESKVTMRQDIIPTNIGDSSVHFVMRQRNVRLELRGLEQLGASDSTMALPELEQLETHMEYSRYGKVLRQSIVTTDSGAPAVPSVRRQALEQLTGGGVRIQFLVPFPDTVLREGMQWTHASSDTLELGMANQRIITTTELRHTYVGMLDTLGRRCYVVQVESVRYLLSGTAEQMGMTMGINGDGVLSARYVIEQETGLPLVIETTAQIDQRMTLYDQGNTVVPMSIDVRGRMVRRL
jgi:hypothetical protein